MHLTGSSFASKYSNYTSASRWLWLTLNEFGIFYIIYNFVATQRRGSNYNDDGISLLFFIPLRCSLAPVSSGRLWFVIHQWISKLEWFVRSHNAPIASGNYENKLMGVLTSRFPGRPINTMCTTKWGLQSIKRCEWGRLPSASQYTQSVFSLFLQHCGGGWRSFLSARGTRYATNTLPSFACYFAQIQIL